MDGRASTLSRTPAWPLAAIDPFDAASLGLYVSSLAGELVRQDLGTAGMLASDVAHALPRAIRDLRGESGSSRGSPPQTDILSMLTNMQASGPGLT
jgi:hypothetical protein